MIKHTSFILVTFLLVIASCKKKDENIINTTPVAQISGSGITNFKNALLVGKDTLVYTFFVEVSSASAIKENFDIVIGVKDTSRTKYNTTSTLQYDAMPADWYSIDTTTKTLVVNNTYVQFDIKFFMKKFDSTKTVMLPVGVLSAGSNNISSSYSTIYYHYIGMELSGSYGVSGTRKNYTGSVADENLSETVNLSEIGSKKLIPQTPLTCMAGYANNETLNWFYIITYDPVTNVILKVEPNDIMKSQLSPNSFVVNTKDYDPVTRAIHLVTQFVNTAGNARVVDEYLLKE